MSRRGSRWFAPGSEHQLVSRVAAVLRMHCTLSKAARSHAGVQCQWIYFKRAGENRETLGGSAHFPSTKPCKAWWRIWTASRVPTDDTGKIQDVVQTRHGLWLCCRRVGSLVCARGVDCPSTSSSWLTIR